MHPRGSSVEYCLTAADINVGFAMLVLRRERVFSPTDTATAVFHSYVYLHFYRDDIVKIGRIRRASRAARVSDNNESLI